MEHPIHLHGQRFLVLTPRRREERESRLEGHGDHSRRARRSTLLVDMSNPGPLDDALSHRRTFERGHDGGVYGRVSCVNERRSPHRPAQWLAERSCRPLLQPVALCSRTTLVAGRRAHACARSLSCDGVRRSAHRASGAQRCTPRSLRRSTYVAIDAPVVASRTPSSSTAPARRRRRSDNPHPRREDRRGRPLGEQRQVPADARVIDATGKTVIPGIIGLHDHMYYGGMKFMGVSYPRLFLGAGVTTIRTTGSVDAYQELNLKRQIDSLLTAWPEDRRHRAVPAGTPVSAPARCIRSPAPDDARRMVRYWAEEGVTWFKAYTQISRAELGAAIDEAHKHGVKVTAHLCSVGFREAVALGIDQLEHGLLTNTEYYRGQAARRLSDRRRLGDLRRARHQQPRRAADHSARWSRTTSR